MNYDIIIVGYGPAGLSAGIYARRAGYSVAVLDKSPIAGGQIINTYEVDNYPGLPGVSGFEIGDKMKKHADKLGVEYLSGTLSEIIDKGSSKLLITNKGEYEAKAVIIATGARNRKLGVPGEGELTGMGVSYCATCDGAFFKGKDVAVIGGGDVALEDAIFLARGCNKVYLVHRRDEFRGAKILQKAALDCDNLVPVYDSVVEEIIGKNAVEKVALLNKKTGEKSQLDVSGVFIAVGTEPNTDGIKGLPDVDERGYIIADETGVTSVPGIFAAGDVRTKQLRQVVTAASDGANCVMSADRYIIELG